MSDEKAIRVVTFDGSREEWEGWEEKFLAKAETKNYRMLLLCKKNERATDVVPTASEVKAIKDKAEADRDVDERLMLILDELNKKAYRDLILSINHKSTPGKVAFRLVKNSKSVEYPEGNCRDAWNRLVAKYSPKTTSSLLKMKKKFENSKLEDGKDPEEWISYLEGIRAEIEAIDNTAAISEKDFMVHVINNLPKDYDVIYDGLEAKLSQTGDEALTIEKMRDKINDRFERIEGLADQEMMEYDSKDETGLAAITAQLSRMSKEELACFAKQFKGHCYRCGKQGHKGFNCPDEKDKSSTTGIKCWTCGKHGHISSKCKSKEKEHAGYAIDDSSYYEYEDVSEYGF